MEAGLNLFSLRSLAQTEADFLKLACELKKIGYGYLQISGVPLSAEAIARVSETSGLPVYLTHAPLERFLNEPQALMEENAVFGCINIGLGYLPPEVIVDGKVCRETVERLGRAAENMKKAGFQFYLHHHHNEFFKHGDKTVFDEIAENYPEIHFIADTYWLQYGGVNAIEYFQRLTGRVECVHLKDYRLRVPKNGSSAWCEPHFAPVGAGTLNFSAIVRAARAAGAEYFFVEQDDAGDYPDPIGQVKQSIDYIKNKL